MVAPFSHLPCIQKSYETRRFIKTVSGQTSERLKTDVRFVHLESALQAQEAEIEKLETKIAALRAAAEDVVAAGGGGGAKL
jgi:endonuclease/exonuclease/phosphatase family metal-dependent hydrolase